MLILAINTASKESALALIQDGCVLVERAWLSNANESQKVLPTILEMFKESKCVWTDLDEVFVVNGPGAYTSLRVGVVIANTIAWQLKIPMRSCDVFEIWGKRIPSGAVAAISSGRDKYLLKGDSIPRPLSELPTPLYGEVPNCGELIRTFGEAVAVLDLNSLKKQERIKPFYVRPPDITTPKKQEV